VTDLEKLRRLIAEPDTTTYSDAELNTRLADTGGDLNLTSLGVWREKMIALASVGVDVSEGGSSRRLSQAYDHAKDMVAYFERLTQTGTGAPIIRKLARQ
jgi:hypothetical protein